jgi:hypothetical protein
MEARQHFAGPLWLEQHLLPSCCPWQFCAGNYAPSHSRGESFLAAFWFIDPDSAKSNLNPRRVDQNGNYVSSKKIARKDAIGESPAKKRKWAPV